MGRKDRKDSKSDDAALFRQVFDDVRPVKQRARHQDEKPARPVKRQSSGATSDASPTAEIAPTDSLTGKPAQRGESLWFVRGGLNRQTERQLRRGKTRVEDACDLHGLTRVEAARLLQDFLDQASARGMRCVRIVHGKGLRSGKEGPVLKQLVADYLPTRTDVRAFCSATAADGGTGAVYVLLKRTMDR